jgi:hypothetical protein
VSFRISNERILMTRCFAQGRRRASTPPRASRRQRRHPPRCGPRTKSYDIELLAGVDRPGTLDRRQNHLARAMSLTLAKTFSSDHGDWPESRIRAYPVIREPAMIAPRYHVIASNADLG